ncbi:Protein of unknown function DUF106 [Abeliophyllum distichum]|uniref:ER membrane protein complex subunit 3 n=1 Tax=Abeliophyllum distichum TaxID=126358 RepID=A0ABD1QHP1_9LAMI
MAEDLVLDTAIRDWVLIPLSVVMVLIGILRYFVSKLMRSSNQVPDPKMVKEGQVIIRARNLRAAANYIPAKSFRARRVYFSNEENGLLYVPKGQAQNAQAQMFSDPNMAMDMMKKNLSMIIPQTLTFAWVNFFFSGFVAAKIPFPLTQRFRSMLQNGIDLSTVDVSYVSSRSWYFLNLFGLRGLFSLILGEENATDDTQRMMQMSGFGFDPTKSLGAEKDSLDIFQHEWALPKFEQRAEAVLKKLVVSVPTPVAETVKTEKVKTVEEASKEEKVAATPAPEVVTEEQKQVTKEEVAEEQVQVTEEEVVTEEQKQVTEEEVAPEVTEKQEEATEEEVAAPPAEKPAAPEAETKELAEEAVPEEAVAKDETKEPVEEKIEAEVPKEAAIEETKEEAPKFAEEEKPAAKE